MKRTALDWMILTRKFLRHPKLFDMWEQENPGSTAVEVRPGRPVRYNPAYSAWLEQLAEELMHQRAEIQGVLETLPDPDPELPEEPELMTAVITMDKTQLERINGEITKPGGKTHE